MFTEDGFSLPPSPPPKGSPPYCQGFHNAIPEFLMSHMRLYIYVWVVTGQSFWMFPSKLEGDLIYGHLWNGQNWVYTRFPWNTLDCFAS